MTPLENYLDAKKKLDEQLKALASRELFKPFFTDLFKKYPRLEAVGWTQYTPHFNDGDPCVFRVGEAWTTDDKTVAADSFDFYGAWEYAGYGKEQTELEEAANEANTFLGPLEDVLHQVFGDGSAVKVFKNGTIESEDYNHD